MSQQPSGWYDDPSNPDMLRYWDGVTWTNHTAPKKSPTAPQSTIGRPYGAVGSDTTGAAATPPEAPTPTTPMPQGGWQQGQQQYQQSPYQQAPQYPGAQQGGAQWMYNVKTTADGVPLASWGKRLAAWLIDGVILAIVGGAISWVATPNLQRAYSDMLDAAARGDQSSVQQVQSEIVGPTIQFGIVLWLVVTAYCLVFWTTTAQTPGKMALGISVRRTTEPGPLPLGTAVMRRLVPLAGQFVSILLLIDYLWPLWDDKRQALHDKVAGTQVVEGKQPRRQG